MPRLAIPSVYVCVCVYVCARACACARVYVCVCVYLQEDGVTRGRRSIEEACHVFQSAAVCYSVLQYVEVCVCCSILRCGVECCSVMQCVVLQCMAVCCSVLCYSVL